MDWVSSTRRFIAATLIAFSTIMMPGSAVAQTFPAIHNNVDAAGVDLKRGSFTYSRTDITTGNSSPLRAPAITRVHNSEFLAYQGAFGPGTTHNFDIKAYETTEAGQPVVVILRGFGSEKFTLVGNAYVPQLPNGAILEKLTLTGSTYYYRHTDRDGTRTSLVPGLPCTTSFGACYYAITIISSKEGTIFLAYDAQSGAIRLRSVISSVGRALYLTYPSTSDLKVSAITAVNLTETYCTSTCTPPPGLPQVSYVYSSGRLLSFTDTLGKLIGYAYDAGGRLQSVTLPTSGGTPFVTMQYDGNGRVSSRTWNGKTWAYTFTLSGSEVTQASLVDPLNAPTITNFGTQPVPTAITDAEAHSTNFGYDSNFRLTSVSEPGGGSVEMLLDGRGNVTKMTRKPNQAITPPPPDRVVNIAFDTTCGNPLICNQPISVTDTKGTTNFAYDPTSGHVLSITSPPATTGAARAETRFAYTPRQPYVKDSAGNPTTQVPNASGAFLLKPIPLLASASRCSTSAPSSCPGAADEIVTTFNYGPTSGLTNLDLVGSVEDATGSALASSFTYNSVGDVATVLGPYPGNADLTTNQYDSERRLVQSTGPDPDGSGPMLAPVTIIGYDDDGRPVRNVQQRGSQWLVSCSRISAAGLVTRQWGPAETASSSTCPAEADPVPVIDLAYDDAGRTSTASEHLPASQGGNRVSATEYFANGWVKKIRRAVGTPLAQDYQTLTYTPDGLPATVRDARGNRTTYEYNGFDELAKLRYPDATNGSVSSTTDFEAFAYDANANLTSHTLRGGSVIGFQYDALDRLAMKDVPEANRDVTYAYDLLDRPVSATLPSPNAALSVLWTYDKLNRTTSETTLGRTVSYNYQAAGAWDQIVWPGSGLTVQRNFDPLGQMTSVARVSGGTIVSYGYDQLSRRISVTNGNGTSTSYAYDTQSRLAALGNIIGGTNYPVAYSFGYNQVGQIAGRTRDQDAYAWTGAINVDRSYQANALDQYTQAGPRGLAYDVRGNLATLGTQGFVHDSENKLVSANGPGTATLTYDAVDRLVRTTTGGVVTDLLYDGDSLIGEYDTGGVPTQRYVHGAGVDEPVLWYAGSGLSDPRWLHTDERGSVTAGSNAIGTGLFVNSYGPFGESGTMHTGRFGYTGQQRFGELGLYYYKARYYSPSLGRFVETDPIGTVDDTNLYNYVGNDPVNLIDPSGLSGENWNVATPPQLSGVVGSCIICNATGVYSNDGIVVTANRLPSSLWGSSTFDFSLPSLDAVRQDFSRWFITPTRHDISGTSVCWKACGPGLNPVQTYSPAQQAKTLGAYVGVVTGGLSGTAAIPAAGRAFVGRVGLSGVTRADLIRRGPTVVSNQLAKAPGTKGATVVSAIKGGGRNLPFHYHIHRFNWYKPWTWFRETPIIK